VLGQSKATRDDQSGGSNELENKPEGCQTKQGVMAG
jgi:hypothetical protein